MGKMEDRQEIRGTLLQMVNTLIEIREALAAFTKALNDFIPVVKELTDKETQQESEQEGGEPNRKLK